MASAPPADLQLAALLGWDGPAGAELTWPEAEAAVAVRLPADFKRLMDRFPSGGFGDRFYVYSPVQSPRSLHLFRASADKYLDWFRRIHQEFGADLPYALHPAPGGLLPWGTGDEACYFWKTDPADPDRWPVVLANLHGTDWAEYPGTVSEFLLDLLTGKLTDPPFSFRPRPEETFFRPYGDLPADP